MAIGRTYLLRLGLHLGFRILVIVWLMFEPSLFGHSIEIGITEGWLMCCVNVLLLVYVLVDNWDLTM